MSPGLVYGPGPSWSGPLDLTLVHCIGPGSGDARECQGGHLGCPWDIYADKPGLY